MQTLPKIRKLRKDIFDARLIAQDLHNYDEKPITDKCDNDVATNQHTTTGQNKGFREEDVVGNGNEIGYKLLYRRNGELWSFGTYHPLIIMKYSVNELVTTKHGMLFVYGSLWRAKEAIRKNFESPYSWKSGDIELWDCECYSNRTIGGILSSVDAFVDKYGIDMLDEFWKHVEPPTPFMAHRVCPKLKLRRKLLSIKQTQGHKYAYYDEFRRSIEHHNGNISEMMHFNRDFRLKSEAHH